ncbi:MAG TPA: hypothetical protein VN174_03665 [Candidatus Methanoperedens sp.]|nr:hypothetical protein [Candidatus Methanoperedens sp.]
MKSVLPQKRTEKPTSVAETLSLFKENIASRKKFVKNEFQAYGLELATELDDWKNKSLYIRLAKNEDRKILEKARYYIKDHSPGQVKSPSRLFMWKLKELRKEKEINQS